MPSVKEIAFGKKGKSKQLGTLSKEQKELTNLINKGLLKGKGPLKDLFGEFNQEEFQKGIGDPAMKQFKEQLLPQLQAKYIAGGQSLGSGQYGGEIREATDLQSRLASLQYGAQEEQKNRRQNGLNTAIGKQSVENIYKPGSEGLVQGAVKEFAHGAGQVVAG